MNKIKPIIKWSGSKSSQAGIIASLTPNFECYYEPFLGGASVMYAISPSRGICGDICEPLIHLWNIIKNNPQELSKSYSALWNELQEDYMTYYRARDRFNEDSNPQDFLFLTRTCVNGLIRFNSEGKFNNSLHYTRKGINPSTLDKILLDWSKKIQNIEFKHSDYKTLTSSATKKDFVYLDPPYFNTKGRYYGRIDYDAFFNYLEDLNSRQIKYILSFDGYSGERDYHVDLPKEFYKRHELITSGISAFRKVMDNVSESVQESLYLNW